VCIRDLHLVTLGNLCDWGFLVTLGDCHHLDGLEAVVSIEARKEDYAVLRRSDCEGYCARPRGDHEEQL
jgi:hypothetical protein